MTDAQAADLIINIRQSATSLINSLNQFRSVQAAYVGFLATFTN